MLLRFFCCSGKKGKVLEAEISVEELDVMRDDNNSDVLARLREDLYAEQLLQAVYWFVTRFRVFMKGVRPRSTEMCVLPSKADGFMKGEPL